MFHVVMSFIAVAFLPSFLLLILACLVVHNGDCLYLLVTATVLLLQNIRHTCPEVVQEGKHLLEAVVMQHTAKLVAAVEHTPLRPAVVFLPGNTTVGSSVAMLTQICQQGWEIGAMAGLVSSSSSSSHPWSLFSHRPASFFVSSCTAAGHRCRRRLCLSSSSMSVSSGHSPPFLVRSHRPWVDHCGDHCRPVVLLLLLLLQMHHTLAFLLPSSFLDHRRHAAAAVAVACFFFRSSSSIRRACILALLPTNCASLHTVAVFSSDGGTS